MDLALNNLERLICHKTQEPNKPNRLKTMLTTQSSLHNIYIYIYISSSSCRAISMDISAPLSPPLPIVHCFWPVFLATSSIAHRAAVCMF